VAGLRENCHPIAAYFSFPFGFFRPVKPEVASSSLVGAAAPAQVCNLQTDPAVSVAPNLITAFPPSDQQDLEIPLKKVYWHGDRTSEIQPVLGEDSDPVVTPVPFLVVINRTHNPSVGGSSASRLQQSEAPPISRPMGLPVMLADTNYFSSEAHSGHSSIVSCCFY